MLFLRGNNHEDKPHAVYLLNDDMEAMIDKRVDRRLRDYGYPTDDPRKVMKDMNFLRSKRLLIEELTGQLITLLIRGFFVLLGAAALLAIKEYLQL